MALLNGPLNLGLCIWCLFRSLPFFTSYWNFINFSSSLFFQPHVDSIIRHHAIHILEMVLPLVILPDEGLLTLIEDYLMKLILSQGMLVCVLSKNSSSLVPLVIAFNLFSLRYTWSFRVKKLMEDQKFDPKLFFIITAGG